MVAADIHDAADDSLVGGVPDARLVWEVDFGVPFRVREKDLKPSHATMVYSRLAWYVARVLSEGLGYR